MKYKQGRYSPKHPEKYVGDPNEIIYRSSLELRCMEVFDLQHHIVKWASEEIIIPYISPMDNKPRRYFPDFVVTARQKDGSLKTFVIEIKPDTQTREPKKQSRKTQRYLTEVKDWVINQAKWEAAKKFCESKGWTFMIMTDKHIHGSSFQKYKPQRKSRSNAFRNNTSVISRTKTIRNQTQVSSKG